MKNVYEIRGDVTAIFLNRRDGSIVEALIDTNLLAKANEFSGMWCYSFQHRQAYVTGRESGLGSRGRMYRLHRWLTGNILDKVIDHISGDTLDNRLANLRIVDYVANGENRTRLNKNNTSGHRGVTWCKLKSKWKAQVYSNRKNYSMGYFEKLEDAVAATVEGRNKLMTHSKENNYAPCT